METLPLVARAPLQAPEAVQAVALPDDQDSVALPPLASVAGVAVSVTVGAGTTVTVALALVLPPAPEQARLNVVVAVSVLVALEPPVALEPDQPPEAVQLVALLDDHVNVELPPTAMAAGLASSVTVGGELTVTVVLALAEPPEPLQLRV